MTYGIEKIAAAFSASTINAERMLAEISFTLIKSRVERNMGQEEFAKFLGVSKGMLCKWEDGDYDFTIKQICFICEKLNWTPTLLLYNDQNKSIYIK